MVRVCVCERAAPGLSCTTHRSYTTQTTPHVHVGLGRAAWKRKRKRGHFSPRGERDRGPPRMAGEGEEGVGSDTMVRPEGE